MSDPERLRKTDAEPSTSVRVLVTTQPIPWRQRQELPFPVDPNCKIDHLRRKRKPKGRRDA